MQKLRKTLLAVATFLVAISLVGGSASADEIDPLGAEHEFVGRLNDLRAEHGLNPLAVDPALTEIARDWATQMAGANQISHRRNLTAVAPSNWLVLGENVGAGPAVTPVHDALVASPTHYANLVNPRFRQVGVGVVVVGGKLFVAQNFMTPEEAKPAAAKACKAKRCKAAAKRKAAAKGKAPRKGKAAPKGKAARRR